MKNVFAFEKKSGRSDGEKFVDRRTEGEIAAKQEEAFAQRALCEKKAGLPLWLWLFGLLCLFVGLLFISILFELASERTLAEVIEESMWLATVGCAGLVIFVIVFVAHNILRRRAFGSTAYRYVLEQQEQVSSECYRALGVPEGASAVDIYCFRYSGKSGKPYKENIFTQFVRLQMFAFREDDCLCLADVGRVFKFPISRITVIRMEKRLSAQGWNKPVPYNKEPYRQYKLRYNSQGDLLSSKPNFAVTIGDGEETYRFFVPPYDIEPILQITGRTVQ